MPARVSSATAGGTSVSPGPAPPGPASPPTPVPPLGGTDPAVAISFKTAGVMPPSRPRVRSSTAGPVAVLVAGPYPAAQPRPITPAPPSAAPAEKRAQCQAQPVP